MPERRVEKQEKGANKNMERRSGKSMERRQVGVDTVEGEKRAVLRSEVEKVGTVGVLGGGVGAVVHGIVGKVDNVEMEKAGGDTFRVFVEN